MHRPPRGALWRALFVLQTSCVYVVVATLARDARDYYGGLGVKDN